MDKLSNLKLAINNVLWLIKYAKFENDWMTQMMKDAESELINNKEILSDIIRMFS